MAKSKPSKPAAKSKKPAKKPAPAKSAKSAKKPAPAKAAKVVKATKAVKAAKVVKPAKPVKAAKVTLKAPSKVNGSPKPGDKHPEARPANGKPAKPVVMTPFLKKQKEKLLQLRDSMLDSMMGVAKDNLRTRAEGSEASAFGMHQADAGSDAYDRDFALSLLSQEQDALYEIEEAIKRIDFGTYGVCEMSGKAIAHARLEALPFARYTVECQSQIEKQGKVTRARVPVTSLFGLTDEEGGGETEEEETVTESKE
jgi:RNA polymerase-binding transcription factor DksA